jgi:hypothetical protein
MLRIETSDQAVMQPEQRALSLRAKVFLVVAFAAIVAARLPNAVMDGRLWAEEGAIYFAAAWHQHWSSALLTVHTGYLNLSATLATLLARHLVPLSEVPRVTMAFALLVQCIPVALLMSSREKWLGNRLTMATAVAIIALAPAALETFLNSINSQHHLTLATALILSLEAPAAAALGFQCAVMALAALSGPGAWMLLPAFAVRTAIERSPARAIQFVVLLASVAVAALFFVPAERSIGMSPQLLGAIVFVKHLVISFVPIMAASYVGKYLTAVFDGGAGPVWPLLLSTLGFASLLAAAMLSRQRTAVWLLLSGGMVACGGYLGALDEKVTLLDVALGGRYAMAPQVLFSLALLCIARSGAPTLRRPAAVLMLWVILIQIIDLPRVTSMYDRGPLWATEVEQWRTGQSSTLALWPPGWGSMRIGAPQIAQE